MKITGLPGRIIYQQNPGKKMIALRENSDQVSGEDFFISMVEQIVPIESIN